MLAAIAASAFENVGDAIRIALPAVACIIAGIVAAKRRAASRRVSDRMSD